MYRIGTAINTRNQTKNRFVPLSENFVPGPCRCAGTPRQGRPGKFLDANEFPILELQVPNPFVEGKNRIYVIRSEPVTMIDTGIATRRAFDALVAGLERHGVSLGDVGRIILTHKHVDHIGNAWRIQQETGAEILIHESETDAVSAVDPEGARFAELVRQRLTGWNVPAEATANVGSSTGPRWELQPATATGIVDGQQIALGRGVLEVIHTPGHTFGSVCLKYGQNLISGDHILPDISPNIGGGDMRRRGLLGLYLESLRRIQQLAGGVARVLPGHGDPFSDLDGRCLQLINHHRQRLDRVIEILASNGADARTVYEIARELFGEMRDFHVVLGCAEAEAHLDHLVKEGRVVGSDRYRLA